MNRKIFLLLFNQHTKYISKFVFIPDNLYISKDIQPVILIKKTIAMYEFRDFWNKLRIKIRKSGLPLRFSKTNRNHFLVASSGIPGITYRFELVNGRIPHIILSINNKRHMNTALFDELESNKRHIHKAFKDKLAWKRKVRRTKACEIYYFNENYTYFRKYEWDAMATFMVQSMEKMYEIFQKRLEKIEITEPLENENV